MSEITLSLLVSRSPHTHGTEERLILNDTNNNGLIDTPGELRDLALLLRSTINSHSGERVTFRRENREYAYETFPKERISQAEGEQQARYLAVIYNGRRV